jgi:hypothetical protein
VQSHSGAVPVFRVPSEPTLIKSDGSAFRRTIHRIKVAVHCAAP